MLALVQTNYLIDTLIAVIDFDSIRLCVGSDSYTNIYCLNN